MPQKQVLEARIGCLLLAFRLVRFILRVIAYTLLYLLKQLHKVPCCRRCWGKGDEVLVVHMEEKRSGGRDTPEFVRLNL